MGFEGERTVECYTQECGLMVVLPTVKVLYISHAHSVCEYSVNSTAVKLHLLVVFHQYLMSGDSYCAQAAWLLRAASCIDLTTLAGDDTPSNVQRLCFKANQPIRPDLMAALGLKDLGWCTLCVSRF